MIVVYPGAGLDGTRTRLAYNLASLTVTIPPWWILVPVEYVGDPPPWVLDPVAALRDPIQLDFDPVSFSVLPVPLAPSPVPAATAALLTTSIPAALVKAASPVSRTPVQFSKVKRTDRTPWG